MTDDRTRELLLDRNTTELDGCWFDEMNLGGTVYKGARLLEESEASLLMDRGYLTLFEAAPPNVTKHLRNHYVCVLSAAGKDERDRIIAEHEGPDELTIATALGAGSPLLNSLAEMKSLISTCAAELIALRCSMMVAAKLSGNGEKFAEYLEAMMSVDAEAREGTD